MIERRTPRGHEAAAIGPDPEDAPPVTAALVDHLAEKFPVTLSPYHGAAGLDIQLANASDQAEQRGQQRVIDYLRNLSNSPNS